MPQEHHHHHLFHHNEDEAAGGNTSSAHDHKEDEKKYTIHEHVGELGATAATLYAIHEKHEAKKDQEHAHHHKVNEEIAAAAAVSVGENALHEHLEKTEEALLHHGKKGVHHHLFHHKDEKHKIHEHIGQLGATTTALYAVHEKHEAKKDLEHAHHHKVKEEIAAAVAIGAGGNALHEHLEKTEESFLHHGKKDVHHHLFHHKDEKHKIHEHIGELGATATALYAVHEKHEAKKDLEHAHHHKVEEGIVAAAAVGSALHAFHEHHENKEATTEDDEAHDKKHHHLI